MKTRDEHSTALNNAHLAAIVQQSLDAVISKDTDGIVRSWNPAAETMLGWTADEIVGKSIRTIIPDDRMREEEGILARIRAGEVIGKFETIRKHKNGRAINVAVTISPLTGGSGRIIGASKIMHDISETLEMRAQIEISEMQFRTLANSIPQLAWIADRKGSIFWYNNRWYEYTGSTLDEMRGWGWTNVHHPEHVERVKARIQQSWDTGEEWEDTFPLRGKDGTYRWFLSRAMPLKYPDGRIMTWFGTNTDVTEQRASEQKMDLLMREVSHRSKNQLAVIQALVSRTAEKEYAQDFTARIQAMSRNLNMVTHRNWGGLPLGELIRSQLASIGDGIGRRVFLEGSLELLINPSAAETIGLAIHELSTNAAKYGAMSNAQGTIHIKCSIAGQSEKFLRIEWVERNGPAVTNPSRKGFGTVMFEQNPRLTLQADIECSYQPTGFIWRLSAPLTTVQVGVLPDHP